MPIYKIKQISHLDNEEFIEGNYPTSTIRELLDAKLQFEVENTKNGKKWIYIFMDGKIYRKDYF